MSEAVIRDSMDFESKLPRTYLHVDAYLGGNRLGERIWGLARAYSGYDYDGGWREAEDRRAAVCGSWHCIYPFVIGLNG